MSSSERKPDTSTLLVVVLQWRPDLLLCRSRREPSMRRRNYGFDRRRRVDLRRAKQEAKQQRKTDREASGSVGPQMGEAQGTGASGGQGTFTVRAGPARAGGGSGPPLPKRGA